MPDESRGSRPGAADRHGSPPDPVDLVAITAECAVCGAPFQPRGGEGTCPLCVDRAVRRTTVATIARRDDALTSDSSHEVTAAAIVHVAAIVVAGVAALAVVAAHWWAGLLGPLAIVVAWSLFLVAAAIASSPILTPPSHVREQSRWFLAIGPFGAALAAAAFGIAAASQRQFAVHVLLDAMIVIGAVSFVVGMSVRLGHLAAWAGADASEEGLFVQAGPIFLGVFATGTGFLMTAFFLRGLDWCDGFALGLAAWLALRALIVCRAVQAAVSSQADSARRQRRDHLRLAKVGDRSPRESPPMPCRACGYDMRGLPYRSRCPECGQIGP